MESALPSSFILPVPPQHLYKVCDPAQFAFQSTAELEGLEALIGQARATEAVRFGAGIRREGYNLFVLGPAGVGKRSLVNQLLAQKAGSEAPCADWCYLNNFAQTHKPCAIKLPSGRGVELKQHMTQLVDYLRTAIPALFDSQEYRSKLEVVQEEFNQRQEAAFKALGEAAVAQQIVLLRTPGGFAFAPTRNHEVIPPDEYEKLPPEEQQKITRTIAELQVQLEKILGQVPE